MAALKGALTLKRGIVHRAEKGHLWVFAREVESASGNPQPGDAVRILSPAGKFLGMALYSKSPGICARIFSRKMGQDCDAEFIKERVNAALKLREDAGVRAHSFRLVHSESDGLPGVVVDVFGDHVVMQISTYAMEIRRNALISALIDALAPTALIEKSDVPQRETDGLAVRKEIIFGRPRIPCEVEENGVKVLADLVNGQKTGYFLDQVKNRSLAIPYFKGARVLDLFCYSGAWSLVAAAHGARETIGVDTSQKALELAAASARLNNFDETKCKFLDRDVFTYARELVERGEKFDVVVLDPPALAKSKKDRVNALAAYRELNLRAMRLLGDDGMLVTCSCSHNVSEEDFLNTLMHAAKDSRTDLLVLHRPSQPPDHPVHLATPETSYLKVFFLKKRVF